MIRPRHAQVWLWLVVVLATFVSVWVASAKKPSLKAATFNIRNFPESESQAAGALVLMGSLDVDVVGVQEIMNAADFEHFVAEYLGPHWRVVLSDQPLVDRRIGLVFDETALELLETRTHNETVVVTGTRATLEVRLRAGSGFGRRVVRVFVVHLKAGGRAGPIRRQQLRRLSPVIADAVASGDEVVLMGDFNTTDSVDRDVLEAFAQRSGLRWLTEPLGCTSYWQRRDDCPTTTLDHILSTEAAESVEVAGACATVGCDEEKSCPLYVQMISDHCPVRAVFP